MTDTHKRTKYDEQLTSHQKQWRPEDNETKYINAKTTNKTPLSIMNAISNRIILQNWKQRNFQINRLRICC